MKHGYQPEKSMGDSVPPGKLRKPTATDTNPKGDLVRAFGEQWRYTPSPLAVTAMAHAERAHWFEIKYYIAVGVAMLSTIFGYCIGYNIGAGKVL
jgi:hypothetical protein